MDVGDLERTRQRLGKLAVLVCFTVSAVVLLSTLLQPLEASLVTTTKNDVASTNSARPVR